MSAEQSESPSIITPLITNHADNINTVIIEINSGLGTGVASCQAASATLEKVAGASVQAPSPHAAHFARLQRAVLEGPAGTGL